MKRISTYLISAFVLSAGVACSSEVQVDELAKMEPADGIAQVEFSIQTPDYMEKSLSRATSYTDNFDDKIYDLGVLVMIDSNTDGNWEFAYAKTLDLVEDPNVQGGLTDKFQGELTPSTTPVKLMLMANVQGDGLFGNLPAVGSSEDVVRQFFSADRAEGFRTEADRMPMYGEAILSEINDIHNTSVTVSLMRSVAKIHITKNLATDSGKFTVTSVALYDYGTGVQVFPNLSAINSQGEINTASIPVSVPTYPGPFTEVSVVDNGTDLTFSRTLITPESRAKANNPTRIVIGGQFNSQGISYYRIDFEPTNANTGKVIRNREYVFNITKVVGSGYSTAAQAASNPANSAVVDGTWYDSFERLWFSKTDGDLAELGETEVEIAKAKGSVSSPIVIESSKAFTWWIDDSNKPNDATQQSNQFVTVNVAAGGGASANSATITIEALTANNSGAVREGKIYFSFLNGGVGGSITWRQLNN